MPIPPEIGVLIDQLNQELQQIEQEAIRGISQVRPLMSLFPGNAMLIRHFAYFNNVLLFVEISKQQIQNATEAISSSNITEEVIQEIGEDLGELLGRVLEAKVGVEGIISSLKRLQ